MATHNEFGKKGEALAEAFLLANNYTILEKNYRYNKAEIDIIAQHEDVLVVVEVKARSTTDFGNPQDFVSQKKIKLLVEAINNYVEEFNLDLEIRFDIIGIVKNANHKYEIEHLENAFYYF
jgi:putative endonuclease